MTLEGCCAHGRLLTAYCPLCCEFETCPHGVYKGECGNCQEELREDLNIASVFEHQKSIGPSGGSSEYYDLPNGRGRLQDVIVEAGMTWNQANIFKAAYRWEKKPDLAYNLRKIIWFAEDELKRLEE